MLLRLIFILFLFFIYHNFLFITVFNYFQYDVELYQRIEQLIGKQLPIYKTEEAEVMVLQERVSEAQRLTKIVRFSYVTYTAKNENFNNVANSN